VVTSICTYYLIVYFIKNKKYEYEKFNDAVETGND